MVADSAPPGADLMNLPDQPTPYPRLWRTPHRRWSRALLALSMLFVLFFVAQLIAGVVAIAIEVARGAGAQQAAEQVRQRTMTPGLLLANNLSLAALIPIAWLGSRIVGQAPGWMSSVIGRFRWRWMLRCLVVLVPLWVVAVAVKTWAAAALSGRGLPAAAPLRSNSDTLFVLLVVVLTTGWQAAGEEFAFRGVVNRAVASWFARPTAGIVAGGLVSALVFTAMHGAGDPWLWLVYFTFGVAGAYLAWRTGGLEAPVAMHAVNNVAGQALAPWRDLPSLFERGAGAAGPEVLIQVGVIGVGVAVIEWQARRANVVTVFDPGHQATESASAQPT